MVLQNADQDRLIHHRGGVYGAFYGDKGAYPLVRLFEEAKARGIDVDVNKANIKCTVFEENEGAAAIATIHKFRPRTKHIHLKYHHFREYVTSGLVHIEKVSTEDQLADIFTKPLGLVLFTKHRLGIMGW